MNTRKYSNAQEKRVAKKLGGSKQLNSGATPFYKGDVKTDQFLIECKTQTTLKESISIKHEWLSKLKMEAFAMNRPYSALSFNFGGLNNKENFYIINESLFIQLMEYLKAEE